MADDASAPALSSMPIPIRATSKKRTRPKTKGRNIARPKLRLRGRGKPVVTAGVEKNNDVEKEKDKINEPRQDSDIQNYVSSSITTIIRKSKVKGRKQSLNGDADEQGFTGTAIVKARIGAKLRDFIKGDSSGKKMKSAEARKSRRVELKKRSREEFHNRREEAINNKFLMRKEVSEKEREEMTTRPLAPSVQLDASGKIVISEESLVFKRKRDDGTTAGMIDTGQEDIRIISSSSFKKKRLTMKWTAKETEMFYTALRQCGTDFTLMSTFFPNRTRDEIKRMFKRQERKRPDLVFSAMDPRAALSLDANTVDMELQKHKL
mmetsp:Transcript_12069/g.14646  ORF Transcript_12069/g.14646 Transcript_12069/m.14646 type:complete len:321 (+) Transcript_12069:92-1054(+)